MDITVGELSWLSVQMYGLAIVISFAVALLIKIVVVVLSIPQRRERAAAEAAKPAARAAPAPQPAVDAAADDIAAIAAAVYAMIGAHRIVRIQEGADVGRAWTAEGRLVHQTSHQPLRKN